MSNPSSVEVCNFSKSLIRWGIDTKIRMPIAVSHKPPFTLSHPNADLCTVESPGALLNIKRWDKTDKGVMRYPEELGPKTERQYEIGTDAFDRFEVDIRKMPGRVIIEVSELVEILDCDVQVVSRTCLQADSKPEQPNSRIFLMTFKSHTYPF